MKKSALSPFRGFFSPGLYFPTGHAMRLYNFTSTPPSADPFFQIWLAMPEGKQILYVDPESAATVVAQWYRFDETVGADIAWAWHTSNELEIEMKAHNGTTLDLTLQLGSSAATALLNTMVRLAPRWMLYAGPMLAVSSLSFNVLLGLGGVHIAGETETGKPYVTEADELAVVRQASATLNDKDLGDFAQPPRPISFGPSRVANRPVVARGTARLAYEAPPAGLGTPS